MLPVVSINDSFNCSMRYAILIRQSLHGIDPWDVFTANFHNLFFGKNGAVFLSVRLASLLDLVSHVVVNRSKKQMGWVAAFAVVTSMKNTQSSGDISIRYHPRHSVNENGLCVDSHFPISIHVTRPNPFPAPIGGCFYLAPKSINVFPLKHLSSKQKPAVLRFSGSCLGNSDFVRKTTGLHPENKKVLKFPRRFYYTTRCHE